MWNYNSQVWKVIRQKTHKTYEYELEHFTVIIWITLKSETISNRIYGHVI